MKEKVIKFLKLLTLIVLAIIVSYFIYTGKQI